MENLSPDEMLIDMCGPAIANALDEFNFADPESFRVYRPRISAPQITPSQFVAPGFFQEFPAPDGACCLFPRLIEGDRTGVYMKYKGRELLIIVAVEPIESDPQVEKDRSHLAKCLAIS